MGKSIKSFVCQSCGAAYVKWAGRCEACGEWNTLIEEVLTKSLPKGLSGGRGGTRLEFVKLKGEAKIVARRKTGILELDRVCGGGLVPGSVILVGGDPGIGKSTLLLQVCGSLSKKLRCIYITGEESIDQIRLRSVRLGLVDASVELASVTAVRDIAASLSNEIKPDIVVIDSIQTMYADTVDSAPGTVTQVRTSAFELIRLAKAAGFILFLVGHVTKEGMLAGPRVLEHMVDTVLYFEGDRGHQFRILRAVKNRFGATDEIGVFEMTQAGLHEVDNPSALFLAERRGNVSGSCVFSGLEGSRTVLLEIQALMAPSNLGTPRRAVVGWDMARLSMILAVLEARCGLLIGGNDIYLNVAGGLRINEPAADLAVAVALISAFKNIPVPAQAVVFGEIGLSGEVRVVAQGEQRLKEAAKLGFEEAWIPRHMTKRSSKANSKNKLKIHEIGHVQDVLNLFSGSRGDV